MHCAVDESFKIDYIFKLCHRTYIGSTFIYPIIVCQVLQNFQCAMLMVNICHVLSS